jgi:hypothetical protein
MWTVVLFFLTCVVNSAAPERKICDHETRSSIYTSSTEADRAFDQKIHDGGRPVAVWEIQVVS